LKAIPFALRGGFKVTSARFLKNFRVAMGSVLNEPKNFRAVMLSSTFTDLKEHRQRAIEAISKLGYMPKVMEHSGAGTAADVIESSMNMVRDSVAYVGIISLKYGQIPIDPGRNPDQLSITELEFNEAMRLRRPIVLFIMSDHHSVKGVDIELDPDKRRKLDAFRERAKRMRDGSTVERVYEVFESLEQFSVGVAIAVGNLARHLHSSETVQSPVPAAPPGVDPGPTPRTLSNVPIDVPRHFVGRERDLASINAALIRYKGRVAITTLHGLGGVGKTTLAAAYAEQHAGEYRATWWIRAEREPALRADLAALGVALNWVGEGEEEERSCVEVLKRLREDGKDILLIYDNAPNAYELRPYLPRGGTAHVLITSRAPNWHSVAEPLAISLWPKEIGAHYLIARTGRENERQAAEALSAELDGLPLAHEQAAAYCEELGTSLANYLEKFRTAPDDLISRPAGPTEQNLMTVMKTFTIAIKGAADRHAAAGPLIMYVAQLADDSVPLFLFAEARDKLGEPLSSLLARDGLDNAIGALLAFAVIDREQISDERDPSIATDCVRLHRLVRIVARFLLDKSPPESGLTREGILGNLVAALAKVFPVDMNPRMWRLFPHVVEVLRNLSNETGESGDRSYHSKLARLVVMALHVTDDTERAGNIIPNYLASVLGDFYEVEPLKGPLRVLLKEHRDVWPKLERDFLSTNNYVLRYAVADALADAYRESTPSITIEEIIQKVDDERPINEFEVGGYALNLIYARDPECIDPSMLQKLAGRREYPGRSIIGDLFLTLAFDNGDSRIPDLRSLLDNDRFWRPIWDFIKIDVTMIEAAQAFMATPRQLAVSALPPPAQQDYDSLVRIEAEIGAFLDSARCGTRIRGVLKEYWSTGKNTDVISECEDELSLVSRDELGRIMKLLFAHPIWVVAETAGTNLISVIARRNRSLLASRKPSDEPAKHAAELDKWRDIIRKLFDDDNWRVQYGACEAAFIMSEHKELREGGTGLFHAAVRRFYKSPICKIRGNCAENLFSHILNSSASDWSRLLVLFDREIRFWLQDEDCWVLEHVFCFFEALHKRHVNVEHLLVSEQSRLLAGAPQWHLMDRQDFLLHIEQRKEEIVEAGY
jgi:Domain of unknown function (DUF4062)